MIGNILMVVPKDQYQDEEFEKIKEGFEKGGQVVYVASTSPVAKGMFRGTCYTDMLITEAVEEMEEFDALVLIGGLGCVEHMWNDTNLMELINKFNDSNKIVSSICLAGGALAKAGILKGKKATVFHSPEAMEIFNKAGALLQVVNSGVIVEGNIITAEGPEDINDFTEVVLKELETTMTAKMVKA